MKALVLGGGGGREHALARALSASRHVAHVHVAPGNAGTEREAHTSNLPLDADDPAAVVDLARVHDVGLVVVGPEAWLAAGVADALAGAGIPCFGPSREAARIETSKAWARRFAARHGIPHAPGRAFDDPQEAARWVAATDGPVVLKADGLAGGKGVLRPDDEAAARRELERLMVEGALGEAGRRVVVEERLDGEEASVLAFCDGRTFATMPPARDHKRLHDGDAGPNTGGMAAYAPTGAVDAATRDRIEREILAPAVEGLAAEGRPFVGVLYAGLVLTTEGPRVLEFNARLGDPEAQTLLPLLDDDLADLAAACVAGRLATRRPRWGARAATTLVAASEGYPGRYARGVPIEGLERAGAVNEAIVLHGGTRHDGERVVTSGGRVLSVTGLGEDVERAAERAHEALSRIHFAGMHHRRDVPRGGSAGTSPDRRGEPAR